MHLITCVHAARDLEDLPSGSTDQNSYFQGSVSRVSPLVMVGVQTLPSTSLSQLPCSPDLMPKTGRVGIAKTLCPRWTYLSDDDSPIVVFF